VKGHPCTSKPAGPIVRAQQKNTANDCEKLSDLDPDPVRRATVTEVSNQTTDTHGQIEAGDQDYRDRNPLTAHSLAGSLGSVLVHRNPETPRLARPGNSAAGCVPREVAPVTPETSTPASRLESAAPCAADP